MPVRNDRIHSITCRCDLHRAGNDNASGFRVALIGTIALWSTIAVILYFALWGLRR